MFHLPFEERMIQSKGAILGALRHSMVVASRLRCPMRAWMFVSWHCLPAQPFSAPFCQQLLFLFALAAEVEFAAGAVRHGRGILTLQ